MRVNADLIQHKIPQMCVLCTFTGTQLLFELLLNKEPKNEHNKFS